jgi:lauroyl/myristoyl acyltransferase
MDQKPSHGRGIEAPFFGVTVPFPAGGPVTAVRANVAVATLMAFRVGWMRYRLHCRVLSTPEDQGRTLESVTHACAAEFERMTRLYPEQWPWSYRRWKWA